MLNFSFEDGWLEFVKCSMLEALMVVELVEEEAFGLCWFSDKSVVEAIFWLEEVWFEHSPKNCWI